MLTESFKNQNILVIGDVILDRYLYGTVDRISPEAPIPVVKLAKKIDIPGGAANVACNIKTLGGNPYLVSIIGGHSIENSSEVLPDFYGLNLISILTERFHIPIEYLLIDTSYITIAKTRIIAHNQHVVRLDEEFIDSFELSNTDSITKILMIVQKLIEEKNIKCIIISDYVKKMLCTTIIINVIKYAQQADIPVIVDSKRHNWDVFNGATIITPNRQELASVQMNRVQPIHELLNYLNIEYMLATLGDEGMMLFQRNVKDPKIFRTTAKQVYDVTGAGDTVVAALSLGIAAKFNIEQAVKISNIAAGISVGKIGTATVSLEELETEIKEHKDESSIS